MSRPRRMSLRLRLAVASAVAVALAVVAMLLATYIVVRHVTVDEIDDALRQQAHAYGATAQRVDSDDTEQPPGTTQPVAVALVHADGTVDRRLGGPPVSVLGVARQVAAGTRSPTFIDPHDAGLRVYIGRSSQPGVAVVVARSTQEPAEEMRRLGLVLLAVGGAGMALAAALGIGVARSVLPPLARLTRAAERVTATGDLEHRIDDAGRDELARLAAAFNEMLASLQRSVGAQRRLVADASHELRTPLTSLRTNAEVLRRFEELDPVDRRRVLDDVIEQVDEMAALVGDVVELARVGEVREEPSEVRFDEVIVDAVQRVSRHWPAVHFDVDAEPVVVAAVAPRLLRAVVNLLDNAAKWSPAGATVQVSLSGGELTVRDHGPGIAEEDLPFVFERFWRAPGARAVRGAGLGLAIVREVAESHGATISAECPDDGGTLMRLVVPIAPGAGLVAPAGTG